MRSLLLLLVLLLVASVAAFKPECSKPTLLTLRGGGIDNGGGNAAYRRPGHTYRAQGTGTGAVTTPFLGDLSNEQEQMSDAERVYVVQQFSQQTVQKASDRFDPRPDVDGLQLGPRSEEEEDDDDDDGALRPQEGGSTRNKRSRGVQRFPD